MARFWDTGSSSTSQPIKRFSQSVPGSSPVPVSMSILFKPITLATNSFIFSNSNPGTGNPSILFGVNTSNQLFLNSDPTNVVSAALPLNVNRYQQIGCSWDARGYVTFWYEGRFVGRATLAMGGTNMTQVEWLGSVFDTGQQCSADMAEWGIWRGVLSPADWLQLANGTQPCDIQPGTLKDHAPLLGNMSPTIERSLGVGGFWSLVSGTLATFSHPTVKRKQPKMSIGKRRVLALIRGFAMSGMPDNAGSAALALNGRV